jgi:hypothetical protein
LTRAVAAAACVHVTAVHERTNSGSSVLTTVSSIERATNQIIRTARLDGSVLAIVATISVVESRPPGR